MGSYIKLLSLKNQIFNPIFSLRTICCSQYRPSNINDKFFSTNPAIVNERFTKLSDDLISEKAIYVNEEPSRRRKQRVRSIDQEDESGKFGVQPKSVFEELQNLELEVRRWSRIEASQLQKIVNSVTGNLTTVESSMLLRSCGLFLIGNTPAERQQLSNTIWNLVKQKCSNMNAQVYNSRMLTQLENDDKFSPVELLNDMENVHQITPSKITYELLIAGFCEHGDLIAARETMEHMKSLEFPISHSVLHSFIRGHIKNSDFEGANNIIKSMSYHGLAVTQETYRTYLLGLAETGNMITFREVLNEMRSEKLELKAKSIYDIIIASTKHQHYANNNQILDLLKFVSDNNYTDALNAVLQLSALEDFNTAIALINQIDMDRDKKEILSARVLRSLIQNQRPADKLLELLNLFKFEGLTNITTPILIYWSLNNFSVDHELGINRYEYGLKIIDSIKSKKEQVKVLDYLPLLKASVRSADVEQIYAITKRMCSDCQSLDDPIMGLLILKVTPALLQGQQTIDDIVTQLKKSGLSSTVLNCLRVSAHLHNLDFQSAAKLVSSGKKFSPRYLKIQMANAFIASNDVESFINLLSLICARMNYTQRKDFSSQLLLNILNDPLINSDLACIVINALKQADIGISSNYIANLKEMCLKLNLPSDIIEIVESLVRNVVVNVERETILKSTTIELEKQLESNENSLPIQKALLFKYSTEGDVSKAIALMESLERKKFVFSPQLLRQIGFMYARYNQDKTNALHYFNLMCSQYPNMLRYSNLLIEICSLYELEGQHADALQLLIDHGAKLKSELQKDGFSDRFLMLDACMRLLISSTGKNPYSKEFINSRQNSLSIESNETSEPLDLASLKKLNSEKPVVDVWKTYDLMEALFNGGFIKKGAYSLLNFTINEFIKSDDVDAVVCCYERCVLRYGVAPQYEQVLEYIHDANDDVKLKKAIELTMKVFDESKVQMKMLFILISGKKKDEAAAILQIPNLKSDFEQLRKECHKLIRYKKEDDLKMLVDISRGSRVNAEAIFQLLRYYVMLRNFEKVSSSFEIFSQNGIKPTLTMLKYLDSVFTSNNIKTPQNITDMLQNYNTINKKEIHNFEVSSSIKPNKKQITITKPKQSKVVEKDEKAEKVLESGFTKEECDLNPDNNVQASQKDNTLKNSKQAKMEKTKKSKISHAVETDAVVHEKEKTSDLKDREVVALMNLGVNETVAKVLRLDEEGKTSESSELLLSSARHLLNNRDFKGFRSMVFEISENKKFNLMNTLRQLKISHNFSNSYFNKKLFITYIQSGKGSEIVDFLNSNMDKLENFVSSDVLTELYEQDKTAFNKLEALIVERGDDKTSFGLFHLHNFYEAHQPELAEKLLQDNPTLKKRHEVRENRKKLSVENQDSPA